MVTSRLPKMYSGNQFIFGIALVMVGIVSFGAIKGSARVGELEGKAGNQSEPYTADPYTYATTAPGVWAINKRNIEMSTRARTLAREGRTEEIKLLLKNGLKVDKDLGRAQTLLMVASESGQLQLVQCLLSRHANADAVDRDGNTPLSLAKAHGHTTIADTLRHTNPGLKNTASSGYAEGSQTQHSPLRTARSPMLRIAE